MDEKEGDSFGDHVKLCAEKGGKKGGSLTPFSPRTSGALGLGIPLGIDPSCNDLHIES